MLALELELQLQLEQQVQLKKLKELGQLQQLKPIAIKLGRKPFELELPQLEQRQLGLLLQWLVLKLLQMQRGLLGLEQLELGQPELVGQVQEQKLPEQQELLIPEQPQLAQQLEQSHLGPRGRQAQQLQFEPPQQEEQHSQFMI